MQAGCDQPGDVRHVHHQQRAAGVADFSEALEVDDARVRAGPGDNQLRLFAQGGLVERVVVDAPVVRPDAVGDEMEVFSGEVDRRAVGQVPARRKVHAHDRVAGLQQRKIDREVRLRPGVGLDVGMLGAEQPARAGAGGLLDLIHKLAAAVVAPAGVPLGVFVGEHAPHGGHHRGGNDIFGGDQLQIVPLALQLLLHGFADFGVALPDQADGVHEIAVHVFPVPSSRISSPLYALPRQNATEVGNLGQLAPRRFPY